MKSHRSPVLHLENANPSGLRTSSRSHRLSSSARLPPIPSKRTWVAAAIAVLALLLAGPAAAVQVFALSEDGVMRMLADPSCRPGSCDWVDIDRNSRSTALAATACSVFQLHETGSIWMWRGQPCDGASCPHWTPIDKNPATVAIAAGSTRLFQLRASGAIWQWRGGVCDGDHCPSWQQIDDNPRTVAIAAAGEYLYQMHDDGGVWRWNGRPCESGRCPHWERLDRNPATRQIVAAATSNLYQRHEGGRVWRWDGRPCVGDRCTSWTLLDNNAATRSIVAAAGDLYQLHGSGAIWRSKGGSCSGRDCPGWERLDNNPRTAAIAAWERPFVSDLSTVPPGPPPLFQVHTDGEVWRWRGAPCDSTGCPHWDRVSDRDAFTAYSGDRGGLYVFGDRPAATADPDADGLCDAADRCPCHPAVDTGAGALVRGRVLCQSPDGATSNDLPLQSFFVRTSEFGSATTDCDGFFEWIVPSTTPLAYRTIDVSFHYDNTLTCSEAASTRLRVMDDLEAAWGAGLGHFGFGGRVRASLRIAPNGRRILELAPLRISTSECEIWRIGTQIANDFHRVRGAGVPGGRLQFMRRAGVFGTTPYTFYDHVDLASNILAMRPGRAAREQTLFHESAHVIRDVADGDEPHWHGDNVDYLYARCHFGSEIFEEPYAFHEGWARYWVQARRNRRARVAGVGNRTNYCDGVAGPRGVVLTAAHLDWVENLVANRLLALADCVGGGDSDLGDRRMVRTLETNPGTIHSLFQFETALCAGRSCCGLNRTTPPPPCPPTYTNDGLTCRGPDGHVIRRYP